MRSAVPALMLPARSLRVAPEIAIRACVASLTGKLRPGPANVLANSFLRARVLSVATRFPPAAEVGLG